MDGESERAKKRGTTHKHKHREAENESTRRWGDADIRRHKGMNGWRIGRKERKSQIDSERCTQNTQTQEARDHMKMMATTLMMMESKEKGKERKNKKTKIAHWLLTLFISSRHRLVFFCFFRLQSSTIRGFSDRKSGEMLFEKTWPKSKYTEQSTLGYSHTDMCSVSDVCVSSMKSERGSIEWSESACICLLVFFFFFFRRRHLCIVTFVLQCMAGLLWRPISLQGHDVHTFTRSQV